MADHIQVRPRGRESDAASHGVRVLSRYANKNTAHSVLTIKQRKKDGKKISMITCYDAAFARIIEQTAIDMVLVGDSLGNVMLGYDDTTKVSMDDMLRHTAAVSRVLKRPLLCADMPFLSYQISPAEAVRNAGRLVQEGGAQCVKLEGGQAILPQVAAIIAAGIPVVGHLGLTPQSVHLLGGYKVQGRDPATQEKMLADAKALEAAGVFAVVLELVPRELALTISAALSIPTIGIGAGPHCDGQVLVLHDLLGFDKDFNPKFLKKYANLGPIIQDAVNAYDQEVKSASFPRSEQSFSCE